MRPNPLKSQPYGETLSICEDYCDHLPSTWCLDWTSPSSFPDDFSSEDIVEITRTCAASFDQSWGWPDLMMDLGWSRAFHARWGKDRGYQLFAIACASSDRERLAAATRPSLPDPGFAPNGALGIHIMAERAEPLGNIGSCIGWEILEANPSTIGDCHSDQSKGDAVTGLLPSHAAAMEVADVIAGKNTGAFRMELVPIAIISLKSMEIT
jgi:hypothetical protein